MIIVCASVALLQTMMADGCLLFFSPKCKQIHKIDGNIERPVCITYIDVSSNPLSLGFGLFRLINRDVKMSQLFSHGRDLWRVFYQI